MKNIYLTILFLLLLAQPAWASTYYVSTSGSDANSCATATSGGASAKRNIASTTGGISCLAEAGGPHTLIIQGNHTGSQAAYYNLGAGMTNVPTGSTIKGEGQSNTSIAPSGGFAWYFKNANDNITIGGVAATEGFTLDCTNLTTATETCFKIFRQDAGTTDGWTIKGIKITNAPDNGLQFDKSTRTFTIENNWIYNAGRVARVTSELYNPIYGEGSSNILQDNLIEESTAPGTGGGGLRVAANSEGISGPGNNIIRRNKISGTRVGIIVGSNDNNLVYNNLILNPTVYGIQGFRASTGQKVYSNTIIGSPSAAGILVYSTSVTPEVKNNFIDPASAVTISDLCTCAITATNITTGTLTDLFTDPAGGDYTVKAGSALIDAGTTLGAPFDTDYALISRPAAAYDVGAYERQTAAATWVLTVTSVNPTTGCAIDFDVAGTGGDCDGNTGGPLTCTYNDQQAVIITAPATCGGNNFTSWTGCNDQGQLPRTCDVLMASDRTVTVNFSTPTGLVAWWKLDEGSGTNAADSAGSNTGTLTAGTNWTTVRGVNTPTLNGTTQSMGAAASATMSFHLTNAFTIRASVLPSTTTGWQAVIIGDYIWGLYSSIGSGYCGAGNPIGFFKHSGIATVVCHLIPLSTSLATRLGLTYDGTTLTMYRNGLAVATAFAGAAVDNSSASAVTIGKSTSYGEYFTGPIWNVKLDDRALTAAEMLADIPVRHNAGGNIAFGGKFTSK